VGMIGTVEIDDGKKVVRLEMTTPGSGGTRCDVVADEVPIG